MNSKSDLPRRIYRIAGFYGNRASLAEGGQSDTRRPHETRQLVRGGAELAKPIRIGIAELLLFAVFVLAYAFLAPNIFEQDWDSLMYGYWAEVKGIRSIWGNHPFGHVLLNSIYVLALKSGYHGKALPVFILCNSVIGGFAVALIPSLMKVIKVAAPLSVGYALILGASYGLWHYSGSADVYSISILSLLLAWILLVYEVLICTGRSPYIPGVFAGLSVLSHQLNAAFLPAALIIILSQKKDRWRKLAAFYGSATSITLAGLLVFGYVANSSFSILALYDWIRSYLADPIYGTYLKLESVPIAWKAALSIILIPVDGRARFVRIAIYSFLITATLLGMTQIRLLNRECRVVMLSAFFQCLVSSFLILWFEPWYPKFWLLLLVPAMIVLACCLQALERGLVLWSSGLRGNQRYYSVALLVTGLVIAAFNVKYAILNQHRPDETSQAAMNIWLDHSKPDDMLITAGDLIPQLWFWSNRPNTIHLYHPLVVSQHSTDRFEYFRDEINQFLCQGKAVIFAPDIVDNFHEPFLLWLDLPRDNLRTFFATYQKEEYFTYRNLINGDETRVYKLVNPNACHNSPVDT